MGGWVGVCVCVGGGTVVWWWRMSLWWCIVGVEGSVVPCRGSTIAPKKPGQTVAIDAALGAGQCDVMCGDVILVT